MTVKFQPLGIFAPLLTPKADLDAAQIPTRPLRLIVDGDPRTGDRLADWTSQSRWELGDALKEVAAERGTPRLVPKHLELNGNQFMTAEMNSGEKVVIDPDQSARDIARSVVGHGANQAANPDVLFKGAVPVRPLGEQTLLSLLPSKPNAVVDTQAGFARAKILNDRMTELGLGGASFKFHEVIPHVEHKDVRFDTGFLTTTDGRYFEFPEGIRVDEAIWAALHNTPGAVSDQALTDAAPSMSLRR